LQIVALLCLAAFAGVVLYQLYAVLGKRVGRQPEDQGLVQGPAAPEAPPRPAPLALDGAPLAGFSELREQDPAFDPAVFLRGARSAYETIVKAFAANDRQALEPLTAPLVRETFEAAIAEREKAGLVEDLHFLAPPRVDLERAEVVEGVARVRVRFLSEYRVSRRSTDPSAPEASSASERRAAEVWTFERPAGSRDPNWTLTRVEAAQA
jgi:predicted lipid-binding transport protein (Tim44 family)